LTVAAFTALFDASVLYAAPVRDLLLELALSDLFRAKWTERINEEWSRNLLLNRPDLTEAQLARTRALMQAHVRDCLVEDYEGLIEALTLPDPDDRHVLAAAIKGRADVIVTFNLGDFPAAALESYGIEAQHPDAFLGHLLDLALGEVCAAAHRVRMRLRQPPFEIPEYLETLERCGLVATVISLRDMQALL
jgi:predicted nucleic acid-binding protein